MLSNLSIGVKKKVEKNPNLDFLLVNFTRKNQLQFLFTFYSPSKNQSTSYREEVVAMPRKGENIYKRKDGRWEGRYILFHDPVHKAKYAYVYGKTYGEVKRKLTEEKGKDKKVNSPPKQSPTYNELLDIWLHSTHLNTKESTQARYAHLINTHIKPQLGMYSLSQLSTEIIEAFIEQQLTDGRLDKQGGLSPKTVTDILTIVKSTIESSVLLSLRFYQRIKRCKRNNLLHQ